MGERFRDESRARLQVGRHGTFGYVCGALFLEAVERIFDRRKNGPAL